MGRHPKSFCYPEARLWSYCGYGLLGNVFKQKPPKVFYGWWVVVASFLIALYVGGTILYGFTAIFEPIASEFGWSYTQISLATSLRGLEMGLLAPVVGLLVDRWGPRKLLFGGSSSSAGESLLLRA